VEDGIGFITLNRPEKRNALFLNSMAEMTDLLKSISKNVKVWVLIIRAQGLACFGWWYFEVMNGEYVFY
jgi:trans-feruloyl-CoA hydratase/vanillin synthase